MNFKDKLKENAFIRKVVKKHRIKNEYLRDSKNFAKYYNDSFNESIQTIEYKILLIVHSLEKGMCSKKLRPFGQNKIDDLISLLNQYLVFKKDYSTSFLMGIAIIKKWINVYDDNNFEKNNIYIKANNFLKSHEAKMADAINVGKQEYKFEEIEEHISIDYYSFIKSRHSVREFSNKPIAKEDLEYCVKASLLTPTACNRQMVKIYQVVNKDKKEELDKIIMGLSGFEKENINYFIFTFDISAFSFSGERNQGYLNAGLVAMNFVNALHNKKIGSCFLQWGNTSKEENNIKEKFNIPKNERIAIIVAAGYYKDKTIIPCSTRKTLDEVFKQI